jgi:hypothetical protein
MNTDTVELAAKDLKTIEEIRAILSMTVEYPTLSDALGAMKAEIAILVENENRENNFFAEELKRVSVYYRRRIAYIQKLSKTPTSTPFIRLDQIWQNCDEILRDRESSARLLTALEGDDIE